MDSLKKIGGIIGKSIENVKKTHKSISDISFETLEKIDPIKSQVKIVKDIHEKIVDHSYDKTADVNNEIETAIEKGVGKNN